MAATCGVRNALQQRGHKVSFVLLSKCSRFCTSSSRHPIWLIGPITSFRWIFFSSSVTVIDANSSFSWISTNFGGKNLRSISGAGTRRFSSYLLATVFFSINRSPLCEKTFLSVKSRVSVSASKFKLTLCTRWSFVN